MSSSLSPRWTTETNLCLETSSWMYTPSVGGQRTKPSHWLWSTATTLGNEHLLHKWQRTGEGTGVHAHRSCTTDLWQNPLINDNLSEKWIFHCRANKRPWIWLCVRSWSGIAFPVRTFGPKHQSHWEYPDNHCHATIITRCFWQHLEVLSCQSMPKQRKENLLWLECGKTGARWVRGPSEVKRFVHLFHQINIHPAVSSIFENYLKTLLSTGKFPRFFMSITFQTMCFFPEFYNFTPRDRKSSERL